MVMCLRESCPRSGKYGSPARVPMVSRSHRPKPMPPRETQRAKLNKDKQKNPVPMCKSLRNNSATQANQKKYKQSKKVVDLEVEEGQGKEDIDAEGIELMMRLLEYISLWKGKAKVSKDPKSERFVLSMPLLPEQVPFEGLWLTWIPLLKIED